MTRSVGDALNVNFPQDLKKNLETLVYAVSKVKATAKQTVQKIFRSAPLVYRQKLRQAMG